MSYIARNHPQQVQVAAPEAALDHLPRATCYRTHTQPDEDRGVFGAVWLADVKRALAAYNAALAAPEAALDVAWLLELVADHLDGFHGECHCRRKIDEALDPTPERKP
jgi:hypothetical protein